MTQAKLKTLRKLLGELAVEIETDHQAGLRPPFRAATLRLISEQIRLWWIEQLGP